MKQRELSWDALKDLIAFPKPGEGVRLGAADALYAHLHARAPLSLRSPAPLPLREGRSNSS